MVSGVVVRDELKRVPGERVAAVVVDRLDGGEAEEEGALTNVHACEFEANAGTKAIKEEALEGVVVESAIGIRHVQAMVARVEGRWQEVLARVDNGMVRRGFNILYSHLFMCIKR